MKFTEALQKCFDTPGEIYIRTVPNSDMKILMKYDNYINNIVFNNTSNIIPNINNFFSCRISRNDLEADWKPFFKEVSWEEANQACLHKGIKVKCICKSNSYISTIEMDFEPGTKDIPDRFITEGKWYILEV